MIEEKDIEFYQEIKELWDDYKRTVKTHGYGKETKKILIKIDCLYPRD